MLFSMPRIWNRPNSFFFFCQKTVAVNQKNHREQANDIGSHPHHCQDRIFSDHGIKATSLRQCIHDKNITTVPMHDSRYGRIF